MRSVFISWRTIAPLLSVLLVLGLCTLVVPLWLGRLTRLVQAAHLAHTPLAMFEDLLAALTVSLGNGS